MSDYKKEQRRLALEQKKAKLEEIKEKNRRLSLAPTGSSGSSATSPLPELRDADYPGRKSLDTSVLDALGTGDINDLLTKIESVPVIKSNTPSSSSPQLENKYSDEERSNRNVEREEKKKEIKLSIQVGVVHVDIPPKEVTMYTKGTQTVPSRTEDMGTSTDGIEQTPNKLSNTQQREFGSAAKRLEFQQQEREEEEAKQAEEEAKEVIEEVEEHKSQVVKTELDPEEKRQIIESNDFKEFIFKSARIVERALLLEENYNVLKDYTRAASTNQETSEQHNVTVQLSLYNERWCKHRSITDVDWSRHHEGLVASSYTTGNSTTDPDGLVLLWDINSPLKTPEFIFNCQSAVMSVMMWPFSPTVVVGGTYSGQIVLWDMRANNQPVMRSPISSVGHTHPVYCLNVVGSTKANNIVSVSTDGRMAVWSLEKLTQPQEVLELHSKQKMGASTAVAVTALAFQPGDENKFYAGSEDGSVYLGFRHGSKSGIMDRSTGHYGPVSSMSMHPQLPNVFLTSSVDWTCKVWNYKTSTKPVYSFEDFGDYVYDIRWSPKHPALFATADGNGVVDLWNLNKDTEAPVAKKQVSEKAVNRMCWNTDGKKLLTGDSSGVLNVLDIGELAVPETDELARLERTLADLELLTKEVVDEQSSSTQI